MKARLSQARLSNLLRQRNLSVAFSGLMFVSNLMLGVVLLTREECTIVIPPELKQSFWVKGNMFAPEYLEEMAVFLAGLILNVTPSSAAYSHQVLLRYAVPESYGQLKAELLKERESLTKNSVSLSFRPLKSEVDTTAQKVRLIGELTTWVGQKQVSKVKETYEFEFKSQRGHIQIASFKYVESKTNA